LALDILIACVFCYQLPIICYRRHVQKCFVVTATFA